MIKKLVVLAITLVALNGCQLTRVEGKVDDVKVKVSKEEGKDKKHSTGGFCPPGQAKKGNC
ncbi:hypothetical protein BCU68_08825 [Vibrio sp. 10N.286.49.B3]|uniref:hypothetical protein n=1 Tax=Vibrio sp. 10N.286.49.B3 TaxID=1880855 RepID=UPI000C81E403|nr:hypothetical protein [Vibrio sp. 10N.286.49.B3]PMH46164.1 hypothetical protein BCU68_08825 [Vibrio sp. 10N.286.49.B3]